MFLMFLMFLISLSFQLNCFHWNPAQHLVGWSPSIGHVHPAGFRARSSEFSILFWIFGSSWLFRFHASFEALIAKTVCSASMMKEVKTFCSAFDLTYSTLLHGHNSIQLDTMNISTRSLTWTQAARAGGGSLRFRQSLSHLARPSRLAPKKCQHKDEQRWFLKNGHFSHFWFLKILQRLLGYLAVHAESN